MDIGHPNVRQELHRRFRLQVAHVHVCPCNDDRYEFICGRPPFEAEGKGATYRAINNVDIKYPSFMSAEAKDFIGKVRAHPPTCLHWIVSPFIHHGTRNQSMLDGSLCFVGLLWVLDL